MRDGERISQMYKGGNDVKRSYINEEFLHGSKCPPTDYFNTKEL